MTGCKHEPNILEDIEVWDKWAHEVEVLCPWGYCVESLCPTCYRRTGNGVGPVACPCDNSRGWKGPRMANVAKPHPPIKAKGRHGGRIQRAQREDQRRRAWMRRWSE